MNKDLAWYSELLQLLPLAMTDYWDFRILPTTTYYQAKLLVSELVPRLQGHQSQCKSSSSNPLWRKSAGGDERAVSRSE